ncbi:hypothetical protein TNIN_460381 [Trichonephila inaurata madagascariensis]|uniref:Uncharacterized protein n=1 Tax=Trichonephila inaurata madagascariensis TaxID=2747483 RepID=A0A8X6Y267_9ARAC|nr:hypothetical protein TNIN_460381 [Trichonephila inaurata madagascariensis]
MKEANCIMAITIITELATMSALPFDLPILYVMDNSRKRKEEFARLNRRLDKGDWKGHICMCMDFSRGGKSFGCFWVSNLFGGDSSPPSSGNTRSF